MTHDKSTMPENFARFTQTRERAGVFTVPRGLKLADIAEELVMISEISELEKWINRIVYIPL